MAMVDRRPTGALRLFFRAPVHLYRWHLGWVLGRRFVYLAHRGRTSGLRRDTVLEAVRYDPRTPEVVVVAAWGSRSDWYRNITASPALEVRSGRERWPMPRQRVLGPAEMAAVLRGYGRAHPRAWTALAPRLGLPVDLTDDVLVDVAARFPAVAFSPAP